jgi:IPT/TIG domain
MADRYWEPTSRPCRSFVVGPGLFFLEAWRGSAGGAAAGFGSWRHGSDERWRRDADEAREVGWDSDRGPRFHSRVEAGGSDEMRSERGRDERPPEGRQVAPVTSCIAVAAGVGVLAVVLCTCGPGPSPNPVPVLSSLSPATATREGPPFTLTVNGSNFVSGASVQWNGVTRPTTFVSTTQVTAQIAMADVLVAQTYKVAVFNPAPGGGTSNALPLDVPCVLVTPGPASTQTRARIGAYYFDGWAGPLTQPHFQGLVNSPFQGREPLSGWQDNNQCAIEQQLAWAHSFGLSFFVFDWFFDAVARDPWDENLNSALEITQSLQDRHGMQFAILYVNQDPYVVAPSDWTTAVTQWLGYMTDPGYVRVNGKPLFVVIDMRRMRSTFGSSAATLAAFDELRRAAQAKGLPGVYIVGDMFISAGASGIDGLFPDLSSALADGYDAVSMYGIGIEVPLATSGERPFSDLGNAAKWIWNQGGLKSPIPFIPLVPDGDDPRSPEADHYTDRPLYWFIRSPQEVATITIDAITWAESNPRVRPEPAPAPPVILIGTWNELGNGAYLVPTLDDGTSYGDALASVLAGPAPRARGVLSLTESGPSSAGRIASGRLVDENGAPIVGAPITLTGAPIAGVVTQQYRLPGRAPPDAVAAAVGFRVNTDDPTITWPSYWFAGPGPSDFSLYGVSYVQVSDGVERIPNGDFSAGIQGWRMQGETALVPSDRGTGQKVQVFASPAQFATLDSEPFPVTPDAAFELSFSAKVPPSTPGSGYFLLAFIGDGGSGDLLPLPGAEAAAVHAQSIPLAPGSAILGTATTDSTGNYQLSLASLGTSPALLEVTYAGDAEHWRSYARTGP